VHASVPNSNSHRIAESIHLFLVLFDHLIISFSQQHQRSQSSHQPHPRPSHLIHPRRIARTRGRRTRARSRRTRRLSRRRRRRARRPSTRTPRPCRLGRGARARHSRRNGDGRVAGEADLAGELDGGVDIRGATGGGEAACDAAEKVAGRADAVDVEVAAAGDGGALGVVVYTGLLLGGERISLLCVCLVSWNWRTYSTRRELPAGLGVRDLRNGHGDSED
jgi:hypothetical protein